VKLGRLRRTVLTYQSDRKRRYNLMAVDPTQYVHFTDSSSSGDVLVGTSGSGQPWAFDDGGRLQVPAGLYYIQLEQSLSYPMTGLNGPTLSVRAYASDGSGGERSIAANHGIVNGEEAPSVNLVAFVDQGIQFTGFPGGFKIDVVQIAPLA
jgi:hypothetical protein